MADSNPEQETLYPVIDTTGGSWTEKQLKIDVPQLDGEHVWEIVGGSVASSTMLRPSTLPVGGVEAKIFTEDPSNLPSSPPFPFSPSIALQGNVIDYWTQYVYNGTAMDWYPILSPSSGSADIPSLLRPYEHNNRYVICNFWAWVSIAGTGPYDWDTKIMFRIDLHRRKVSRTVINELLMRAC